MIFKFQCSQIVFLKETYPFVYTLCMVAFMLQQSNCKKDSMAHKAEIVTILLLLFFLLGTKIFIYLLSCSNIISIIQTL